jgi:hypothetical protein
MSFKDIMNVPAKESVLFWIFIGIIIAIILIIVLRDFFQWYFGVKELRDQVSELNKKIDALGFGGFVPSNGVKPSLAIEAEVAAAIAAAVKAQK